MELDDGGSGSGSGEGKVMASTRAVRSLPSLSPPPLSVCILFPSFLFLLSDRLVLGLVLDGIRSLALGLSRIMEVTESFFHSAT